MQVGTKESPFDELQDLIKKYELKGVWDGLERSKHSLWETCRNLDEHYKSKQAPATQEIEEKTRDLVLQLSAPSVRFNEFYFSGPNDIMKKLKENHTYKTFNEPNNQGKGEPIYQYEDGIHVRAEGKIKEDAQREYMAQWEEMAQICQDEIQGNGKNVDPKVPALLNKLETALHRGPSAFEIMEVLEMIRRTTFVDPDTINPHSHIPFRNGLLNLDTFELEPHDPEKFYTYRVEANYISRFVSLKEAPLFNQYIRGVFHPLDIPQVLQYMGYSLMPAKPRDKVLFIVGREGIGKGVLARLMEGLLGEGNGAIDLNKLFTSDRFQFSGLDGHVLLVDPEIDRKFRRDAKVSPRNFNTLFGSDAAYTEKKFHEGKKKVYHAKGLFLGNLPLFKLDDMAAFRRILLVQTLTERPSQDVPNLHLQILEKERDIIATLLVQYLKVLKECDWIFINEPTKESIGDLWAQFADPIAGFEDEYIFESLGNEVVVGELYKFFVSQYCQPKGITPPRPQTFTARIARNYPKVRNGEAKKRYYKFQNLGCEGLDQYLGSDKREGSFKLDIPQIDEKPPEIKVSRDNRYGVQLNFKKVCPGGGVRVAGYTISGTGWTSDKNDSGSPENKAPEEIKGVSNLNETPKNDSICCKHGEKSSVDGMRKYYVLRDATCPFHNAKLLQSESEVWLNPEHQDTELLIREGIIRPFKEGKP